MFGRLLARVRGLLGRARADDELDEELRFHVEMETGANVERGMDPAEARRRALVDLGGLEPTRERARRERATPLDDVGRDLRGALRLMRRDPRQAVVVVATVGLSVGLATAVYSVATSVLLRPLPYEDPERLVVVFRTVKDVDIIPPPIPELLDLRARSRTLAALGGLNRDGYAVVTPAGTEWADAFVVTANLFTVLGVRPVLGRTFLPGEDQPGRDKVVVLGEEFWRRALAADPKIVGRRIRLAGRDRPPRDTDTYEVVGIVPSSVRLFYRLPLRADIYVPYAIQPADTTEQARMSPGLIVFGRLAAGATREAADREVHAILKQASAEHRLSIPLAGSRVTSLHEELVGQTRPAFALLAGASGVLLAIGFANVASLLLASGFRRRQELAVRLALGCSRSRLFRQLVTEHLILAAAGGALGALLALLAVPAFRFLAPESLPRAEQIAVHPAALLFALAISLSAGLVSGAVPAWIASAPATGEVLKSVALTVAPRGRRLRAAFVVATAALALALVTAAGLIGNGLWRLAHLQLGFDPSGVLAFSLELPDRWRSNGRWAVLERELLAELRAMPGIERATTSNSAPFGWGALNPRIMLPSGRSAPPADVTAADPEYLRLLSVPLVAGRLFDAREVGNASIAVVNDAFAKQLGGTRAVGQRITLADREREIVGVVASITEVGEIQGGVIKRAGFRRLTTPAVYVPSGTEYEGEPEPFDVILVRSALPVQVVSRAVAGQLRRFDPELTIRRAGSLEQQIRTIGADARFFATIIAAFAVVSLVLACVGLCGLLAQAVAQRLREIGIRVALGAGPVRVVWLVVSEGAVLVGAGLILGLPLSGAAGKAATALLFEVGPADPLTLTGASILLAVVAVAALWAPARRAARVDVVAMLKAE